MTANECDRIVARLQRGWTQGAFARDKDGNRCGSLEPQAVAWCVLGAVFAEGLRGTQQPNYPGSCDFSVLNDAPSTTLDDVIAALRAAVEPVGGAV